MIYKISISNYKCIKHEVLPLKPLTIVTGLNSTGKSTFINSILLIEQCATGADIGLSSNYDVIRSKYLNEREVELQAFYSSGNSRLLKINPEGVERLYPDELPQFEKGIYYLSANRIGIEEQVRFDNQRHAIGVRGESVFNTFELEKSEPVIEKLRRYTPSFTLQHQVNYWLSEILGLNLVLSTQKNTQEKVDINFSNDKIQGISPKNLGAGVSYLVKVLITCLRAKENDILLLENPEIHLHPYAQAKLGEFLTFIASAGIQVIVETHCEHLINKVQYEIYKKHLPHDSAILLYKANIVDNFQTIQFKPDGNFAVHFPEGFFDATLKELMEME
jgi:predicted ATPase